VTDRPCERNITAATRWNCPGVNAFDLLAWTLADVRIVLRAPFPFEVFLDQPTFDAVAFDAPGGLLEFAGPWFDLRLGPKSADLIGRVVVGDTGVPGRAVIRPVGGGDDVWVDTGVCRQ
jgi:hypothetical protein